MAGDETTRVWRYGAPGVEPMPLQLPKGVDPTKTAGEGRWRGLTCCCESEECGTWVSDIDTETIATTVPLPCPSCHERGGFPKILWREAILDCQFCGTAAAFGVIDPSEVWPDFVDCPQCQAPVRVPQNGTALYH